MLTGAAGLLAGALSMAAGEYISVQSQADTENADLALERSELAQEPEMELDELTDIYVKRGLTESLARQVAEQLTEVDALSAHARDELGITETFMARPIQAALASAAAFSLGAIIPVITAALAPTKSVGLVTGIATVATLAALGTLAAFAGGAPLLRGAIRVTFWGILAMVITAAVGKLIGATL